MKIVGLLILFYTVNVFANCRYEMVCIPLEGCKRVLVCDEAPPWNPPAPNPSDNCTWNWVCSGPGGGSDCDWKVVCK